VERRAGLYTRVVVLLIYIYITRCSIVKNIDQNRLCNIRYISVAYRGVLFSIRETSLAVPPPNRFRAPFVLFDDDIAVAGMSRDEFFWIRRCVSSGTFRMFRVVCADPPEDRSKSVELGRLRQVSV